MLKHPESIFLQYHSNQEMLLRWTFFFFFFNIKTNQPTPPDSQIM